jgi:hypothetical protein
MKKTCAYCNYHCWADERGWHVCLLTGDGEAKDMTDTCDLWKESRRGKFGCTDPDHKHVVDYAAIDGHVKDDKYTRRNKT